MNAQRYYLTLIEAASVCYPRGWRIPITDEIDVQRATEDREDARREADSYTTDNAIDWSER